MVDNTKIVRQKVEKSRPSQKRHTDIEKLEDEVSICWMIRELLHKL